MADGKIVTNRIALGNGSDGTDYVVSYTHVATQKLVSRWSANFSVPGSFLATRYSDFGAPLGKFAYVIDGKVHEWYIVGYSNQDYEVDFDLAADSVSILKRNSISAGVDGLPDTDDDILRADTNYQRGGFTPSKAPECIGSTAGAFVAQNEPPVVPHFPSMPNIGFYLVVRYLGEDSIAGSPSFDFSAVTGLSVPEPRAAWQRARTADATPATSSAFQLHCEDAGSWLDTATFPWRDVVGGGPHTVYGFAFNDPPPQPLFDASPGTEFVIQASAEVPWFRTTVPAATLSTPGPIGQVNLFAYFRDRRSAKVFGLVLGLFDSRYGATGTYQAYVSHDTYTPFVSQPLGGASPYVMRPAQSQSFTGLPWSGLRLFRGHVTQDRFARAAADVNAWCREHRAWRFCDAPSPEADAFSVNPLDYEVTDFGVLHEVLKGVPGGDLGMGLHVSGLGLWNAR